MEPDEPNPFAPPRAPSEGPEQGAGRSVPLSSLRWWALGATVLAALAIFNGLMNQSFYGMDLLYMTD